MRSEYSAMQSLADSKEEIIQNYIADRNAHTRLSEQLEKQRKNAEFWQRVRRVIKLMAVALVIYTLIHFA